MEAKRSRARTLVKVPSLKCPTTNRPEAVIGCVNENAFLLTESAPTISIIEIETALVANNEGAELIAVKRRTFMCTIGALI